MDLNSWMHSVTFNLFHSFFSALDLCPMFLPQGTESSILRPSLSPNELHFPAATSRFDFEQRTKVWPPSPGRNKNVDWRRTRKGKMHFLANLITLYVGFSFLLKKKSWPLSKKINTQEPLPVLYFPPHIFVCALCSLMECGEELRLLSRVADPFIMRVFHFDGTNKIRLLFIHRFIDDAETAAMRFL